MILSSFKQITKLNNITKPFISQQSSWKKSFSSDIEKMVENFESSNSHSHQTSNKRPIVKMQFFTSKDCSLCFPAKRIVERIKILKKLNDQSVEYVDIYANGNEKWKELYKNDIPVLHINEKFAFKHRIDQKQLENIIEEILLKTERS